MTVPGSKSTAYRLLDDDELLQWRTPVLWRAALALSSIWVQIGLAITVFVAWPNVFTFLVAFVLVAAGQHGLTHATHEFVHGNVMPTNQRRNDAMGTWLFGAPILLPFELYRHRHLLHHRLYGRENDTKDDYRRDLRGRGLAIEIIRCLSGAAFLHRVASVRMRARADGRHGDSGPRFPDLLPSLVLTQGILLGLFSLVNPWLYLTLWLLPLVTLSNLLLVLRSAVEHQPLESEAGAVPDSGYFMGTPGPFVRSVTAGSMERLFLGRLNFGLHAEHHLWPQLSYQYLPAARRRLEAGGAFSDPCLAREAGYLSTLRKLWRPPSSTTVNPE